MNTDRIEKTVLLRASRERVWRAISDAGEFGTWFGVAFDGPFAEHARLTGRIVPTKVDAEVAKKQEPHAGMPFEFVVGRIEPMDRISFQWHPFAIEPGVDYSQEPMTLIVFALEDVDGGTRLTITETGFDRIPIARRAKAFAANDGGWTEQARLVQIYLASHADA
jgi:uncharacterized protein YndB with AHSA1/START domain